MWLFTIYGFFSVACASKPDGSLDRDTLMIRARRSDHLRKLQKRFPSLPKAKIITLTGRDYRYRIIVPKNIWVAALTQLAEEHAWSNFKRQVAKHQGTGGADYIGALHEVWEVMNRFQGS
jgi:hypothetical protein